MMVQFNDANQTVIEWDEIVGYSVVRVEPRHVFLTIHGARGMIDLVYSPTIAGVPDLFEQDISALDMYFMPALMGSREWSKDILKREVPISQSRQTRRVILKPKVEPANEAPTESEEDPSS